MLQSYATQRFLDLNNIENETINISCLKDFKNKKRRYFISQLFNIQFYKAKGGMLKLKIKKKINRKLKKKINTRDFEFKRFETRYFKLTKPFIHYSELTNLCSEEARNVVVGSDQLWLPANVAADYYTLTFVPDEISKISYATSFGVSSLPKRYIKKYKYFLNRFDKISVREIAGKEMVESLVAKECKVVCDPIFLLSQDEWNAIISDQRFIKDKYILCYFLGKAKEHRQFAEKIKKLTGYKIVSINHCDEFVRYGDKFADETPYNVGPSEWLNLIKNAEFVCTDSYHGAGFSIIFGKPFFSFRRYTKKSTFSTNSRLDTLLGVSNLKSRLRTGLETFEEVESLIKSSIDYDSIREKLALFINESKRYYLDAVSSDLKENKLKGIQIVHKPTCMGCTACKNICPKNAIEMVSDEEGFLYPCVHQDKCVDCGLCKSVCPSINLIKEEPHDQSAYLIRNLDKNVLMLSTSGGAFTAISNYILNCGGVVFGACFDDNQKVNHIFIENKEDVYKFRNSKYVQSDLKNVFKEVRNFLMSNRVVLFSGTPCQIEGLKSYLKLSKTKIDKLFLVDVVCHGVPSPLFWEKYKEYSQMNKLTPQQFRSKEKYGYEYSQMSFIDSKNKKKYYGVETDPFLRGFYSGLSLRPSCLLCHFKKRYRESDLTIWDCFTIYKYDKKLDDNKGITRCLVHTTKGNEIINGIKEECFIKEIDADKAVMDSKELFRSVKWNNQRDVFLNDLSSTETKQFFKKWFPMNFKVRFMRFVRKSLEALGIYRPVKRTAKKILGK